MIRDRLDRPLNAWCCRSSIPSPATCKQLRQNYWLHTERAATTTLNSLITEPHCHMVHFMKQKLERILAEPDFDELKVEILTEPLTFHRVSDRYLSSATCYRRATDVLPSQSRQAHWGPHKKIHTTQRYSLFIKLITITFPRRSYNVGTHCCLSTYGTQNPAAGERAASCALSLDARTWTVIGCFTFTFTFTTRLWLLHDNPTYAHNQEEAGARPR